MANSNTSIRFSAEGLNQIRSESSQLMRDLIRDNTQYNNSARETIELINRRINLLNQTRQNTLTNQRIQLQEDLQQNRITQSQYTSRLQDITRQGTREDITNRSIQEIVELLRIIRDTGARDVEAVNQLRDVLGVTDDSDELNTLLQQVRSERESRGQEGRTDQPTPKEERQNRQFASMFGFALSNLIRPLGAEDPARGLTGLTKNVGSAMMMSGGKTGIVGLILNTVSEITDAVLEPIQANQLAARANIQLRGGNLIDFYKNYDVNEFRRYTDIGLSLPDIFEQNATLSRARGRATDYRDTGNSLASGRAFGLDAETLSTLQRSVRGTDIDLSQQILRTTGYMRASGMAKGDDFTLMNEYLSTLADISQRQLIEVGEVNLGVNNNLMQAIANVGEKFTNPQLLQGVFSGIVEGLSSARTPQVEALQFQTLSGLMPEGSLWELEKIRENPTARPEYLGGLMQSLATLSGGDVEMMARNFSEIFFGGAKKQISEDLVRSYLTGGDFVQQFAKASKEELTQPQVFERAKQATTDEELRVAEKSAHVGAAADSLRSSFEDLITTVSALVDILGSIGSVNPAFGAAAAWARTSLPFIKSPKTNNFGK